LLSFGQSGTVLVLSQPCEGKRIDKYSLCDLQNIHGYLKKHFQAVAPDKGKLLK